MIKSFFNLIYQIQSKYEQLNRKKNVVNKVKHNVKSVYKIFSSINFKIQVTLREY